MKKIPENILFNILESADLYPEDKGLYFKVLCPACGHKEAFVYKNNLIIACSRKNKCDYIGNVKDLIDVNPEVKKKLAQHKVVPISKKEEISSNTLIEIPKNVVFFADKPDSIVSKRALNYLKGRKLSSNVIDELGYIYNPNNSIELGIFIPFYENKELVYYIIRNTDKNSANRFDNPKETQSSHYLYNYDKINEGDTICIFEGVFDALSLTNHVGTAMLTSSLSSQQASKIYDKAPKTIIYVPDNDKAGEISLIKNIKTLMFYKPPSVDIDIYVYNIPNGYKDFNEYTSKTGTSIIDLKNCYSYFKQKTFSMKRKSPL